MSSTRNFNILIPHRKRIVLSTYQSNDVIEVRIEILFLASVGIYVVILGTIIIVVLLVLKYLGSCINNDQASQTRGDQLLLAAAAASETDPLLPEPEKIIGLPYGTDKDGDEGHYNNTTGSSNSDNLYDGKICVICYDIQRNCFFVPCGHCATCHHCALRVIEEENKVCPICRRFIHKFLPCVKTDIRISSSRKQPHTDIFDLSTNFVSWHIQERLCSLSH